MFESKLASIGKMGSTVLVLASFGALCVCMSCGRNPQNVDMPGSNAVAKVMSNETEGVIGPTGHTRRVDFAVKDKRHTGTPDRPVQHKHAESEGTTAREETQAAATSEAESAAKQKPKLRPDEFLEALRAAVSTGDANAIRAVLDRVPQDAGLVDSLKGVMSDAAADAAIQRYAAEALVRVGTSESVQYVLGQLLAAYRSGDEERANTLLASLEAPTSAAGTRAIFDFLLGQGNFAHSQEVLPQEAVSAVRKALLAAPDREAVGNLAARLYLDPQTMTNNVAMWELFDGVSHPLMLAQLAARAYQENLPDNAAQFLTRLGASDDQSVVQALVQLVPNPSVPLDNAAMALYDWSIAHPQVAQPGLFIEYMTDQNRAPEQRSVAAFGLAGSSNREYAQQAIQKALSLETAPAVRTNLQTALDLLNQERPK